MTTQLVMKQLEYYCAHYEDGSYNSIPYQDIFENTCFVVVPMVNPDGVNISQFGEHGINRQDLKEQLRAIYDSDIIGGFSNWCVIEKGIPSVTVEMGSVPTPLPLDELHPIWNRNRELWVMLGSIY